MKQNNNMLQTTFSGALIWMPPRDQEIWHGGYPAALGIYLWLGQQRPLPMYGDNAVRAAKRAGMPWVKAAGDVAWVVG